MVLSMILFVWLKNHYIVTPEGEQIGVKPNSSRQTKDIDTVAEVKSEFTTSQIILWSGIAIALFLVFLFGSQLDVIVSFIFSLAIAVPGFILSDKSLEKAERERIWVIY